VPRGHNEIESDRVHHAKERLETDVSTFAEFGLIPESRAHVREQGGVDLRNAERASGTAERRSELLEVVDDDGRIVLVWKHRWWLRRQSGGRHVT